MSHFKAEMHQIRLQRSPRPSSWILRVLLLREGGEGKGREGEGRGREGERREGKGRGRKGEGKEGGKPLTKLSHTPVGVF